MAKSQFSGRDLEAELVEELDKNANSKVRPPPTSSSRLDGNLTGPVLIDTTVLLYQLLNVEQKINAVTLSGSFILKWEDSRLGWDPDKFGGIERTFLALESIWGPDLSVYFGVIKDRRDHTESLKATIRFHGEVYVEMPIIAESFCPIDVKMFPFDEQNCTLTFGSWSYPTSYLLYQADADVDISNYYDNQEWILLSAHTNSSVLITGAGDFSVIHLQFQIKRQSFYYIFNLVIPASLIATTAVVGIFSPGPGPRKPRIKTGIITLLPMGLLMLTIADDLPKFALQSVAGKRGSFSSVPLLSIYYLCLLVLMSVSAMSYNILVWLERYALNYPDTQPPIFRKKNFPVTRPWIKRTDHPRKISELPDWNFFINSIQIFFIAMYLLIITTVSVMFIFNDWRK